MQIKLFTIPVGDNGSALQEMNAFLRGNKVIEVENKLIGNENGAYWCFCVRYIERAFSAENGEQKDFQRHITPLTAFTQHADARSFRQKAQETWLSQKSGAN